jgi:hypothetical protein
MLALAEALGLPYEVKTMAYNGLRGAAAARRHMLHLTRRSRSLLTPPWPDLVVGVGCNSLPVARYIRRRSGGSTRIVQLGNPRSSIEDLDLLIATPQFVRSKADNVLAVPFPIGDPARLVTVTREENHWLSALPSPRRLVAVGGNTRKWKIDNRALEHAIGHLQDLAQRDGGSVIAVTSPRTPVRTTRLLRAQLTGANEAVAGDFPRFAALLARCDEIHVTADSVSMLSEAILTGKPVGMIGILPTFRGIISRWARGLGLPHYADLAKFWRFLEDNKLVGTAASPVASEASDSISLAEDAVRRVLQEPPRRLRRG